MTDHLSRFGQIRSISQISKQTAVHLTAHPFTFLFLSLLLFSFRSLVQSGSFLLTSFVDRDPAFKSLLSRLDAHPPTSNAPVNPTRRHTRRPFLHLTRVGTLEDDFFSSDDDRHDRSLFGSSSHGPINGTHVILSNFEAKFGVSNFVTDNGISLPKVIRHGVKFKTPSFRYENREGEKPKGYYELSREDAAALFLLVCFLSFSYGWVILVFTTVYSLVIGVVFVTVIRDLIVKFESFWGSFWNGSQMGLKRLTGFVLMKWAIRDAVTQLIGLWYFGEIDNHHSFFKLFVGLKLMPFSVLSSSIKELENENISGFLFTWFLFDTLVTFAFSIAAWIAIVDSTRTGKDIVKEGCCLMSTSLYQAIRIKCYEAMLGGSFATWVLSRIGGEVFATFIQAVLEVYFMVVWLIFYFVLRFKEANAEGRTYGRRELEVLIDERT